jgi:tetratricopeptide (TPR) repeat protein
MRIQILAAALASFQALSGPAPAQPPPADARILQETGYVGDGSEENGGWIRFAESRMRFRLPANPRERETLVRLLGRSAESGVAIRVRYAVSSGRPDPNGDYVEYTLCSVSVGNGATFGNEVRNCPAQPAPQLGPGEAPLVQGMAEVSASPQAARRSLATALGTPDLNPRLRAIALEARGAAAETLALALPWASESFDRMTFEGLTDYRAWAAAAPDQSEPLYATARLLADLGGYDEALAIYRAVEQRWPMEGFLVAVRTGALYRRQGRYAEALAALDAFGEAHGMRYRYHRAWTLELLNRPAEALREINQGFESQPDYPYAFFIRACANGKLGHLSEALADEERGVETLTGYALTGPYVVEELGIGRTHVEALRRLVAAGGARPTDIACEGHWARDIRSRPRSALLGSTPR